MLSKMTRAPSISCAEGHGSPNKVPKSKLSSTFRKKNLTEQNTQAESWLQVRFFNVLYLKFFLKVLGRVKGSGFRLLVTCKHEEQKLKMPETRHVIFWESGISLEQEAGLLLSGRVTLGLPPRDHGSASWKSWPKKSIYLCSMFVLL